MLPSPVRSALWFLKRPALYPQFFYLAWQRLALPAEPDTSAEAETWCRDNCISTQQALARITGGQPNARIEERYKELFAEAIEIERRCPEWMGGPGDLDLLYHLVKYSEARSVIETGVAYGWSSLAILLALEENGGGRLISSDMPYVQGGNDRFVGCVVAKENLRRNWELVRKADRQALPYAIRKLGRIDLCHYDSDKSSRGRRWAYPLLWQALRDGGIFISDDVSDNTGFRDFAMEMEQAPIVVKVENERHTKFVGVLIKPTR